MSRYEKKRALWPSFYIRMLFFASSADGTTESVGIITALPILPVRATAIVIVRRATARIAPVL